MRVGIFEVTQSLPRLKGLHAIAMLKPWLDAGSVGTMVLQRLETRLGAKELAKLARPGSYYDFTRYRPLTTNQNGIRRLIIPNTSITYASSGDGQNDFIFLHLLEPHMFGEIYAESVWQFLKILKVQRYCLLGSFYDMVPHTRPILISGGFSAKHPQDNLQRMGIQQSRYEGPTTICNLISQEAEKTGVETLSLLAHLPNYTELEEDYLGIMALMQALHSIYDFPINEADIRATEAQSKSLDGILAQDSNIKTMVKQLESEYDARIESTRGSQQSNLSPEINKFLKEMEKRFKDN